MINRSRFMKGADLDKKARLGTGFLYLSFFLEGKGPIGWFVDLVKGVLEWLQFANDQLKSGEPLTVKDFVFAYFEEQMAPEFTKWYENIATISTSETKLLESIFYVAAALAFLILIGQFAVFFWQMIKGGVDETSGLGRSQSGVIDTGKFMIGKIILPMLVITVLSVFTISMLYAIRVRFARVVINLYEPETIGSVMFELLTKMLEGKQIGWLAFLLPAILVAVTLFLIAFAATLLWSGWTAIWGMFQVARYGTHDETGLVIADISYSTLKPLIVSLLMIALLFGGPGFINTVEGGFMPIALGILFWFAMMAGLPLFMAIFAFPKLERNALASIHKVQHFVHPKTPYVPRQWFLNPEKDSPFETSDVWRKGVDVGERAFGAYKTVSGGKTVDVLRRQIRDRLRK